MTKKTFEKITLLLVFVILAPPTYYVSFNYSLRVQALYLFGVSVLCLIFNKLIYEPIKRRLPD
jgi:hypothetical protein